MSSISKRIPLLIASLSIGILMVGLFYPTFIRLLNIWSGTGNSHGYVLAIIFIYAFAKLLTERAPQRPNIHFLGLVGLAGVSVFWLLTKIALIDKLELLAVVFVPFFVVWALYGFRIARWFILPTLILVFSTPIFQLLHNQMQVATAIGSDVLLQIMGLTFYREGLVIYIPNGGFVVEKGCSGLGALTMGIAIALIYAWINRLSWKGTILSVLVIAFLAYLSNVVRVCIIIFIGTYYSMDHPLVTDHGWVGWTTFAVVIVFFILLAQRFVGRGKNTDKSLVEDTERLVQSAQTGGFRSALSVVLVVVLMAVGPALYSVLKNIGEAEVQSKVLLPDSIPGWEEVPVTEGVRNVWKPSYEMAGSRLFRQEIYQRDKDTVQLYAMVFSAQKNGDEAININNRSYDVNNTARISVRKSTVNGLNVLGSVYEEHLRVSGAKDMLVWTVYDVQGRWIGSPSLTKLFNLYQTLLGRPALTVLIMGVEIRQDDRSEARNTLNRFTRALKASQDQQS